jgi:hypothetical protein
MCLRPTHPTLSTRKPASASAANCSCSCPGSTCPQLRTAAAAGALDGELDGVLGAMRPHVTPPGAPETLGARGSERHCR